MRNPLDVMSHYISMAGKGAVGQDATHHWSLYAPHNGHRRSHRIADQPNARGRDALQCVINRRAKIPHFLVTKRHMGSSSRSMSIEVENHDVETRSPENRRD